MSITRRILAGTAIAGAALAFTAGVANADQGRQAADDTAVTASACGQSYTDYVPAGYEQSQWEGQLFDRNTGFSTPAIVDFRQEAAVVTLPQYGQRLVGEARYEQGLRFDTRTFAQDERSTIAFRAAEATCYGQETTDVNEMRGTAEVAPFMLPVAGQLEFQLHRVA